MGGSAYDGVFRFARALARSRARHRAFVIVRLLQVLALVFTMQLSGAAHGLADALFHDARPEACEHDSNRDGDDDDSDCPPGCPTCHACAHTQTPYVARPSGVPAAPFVARSLFDKQPDAAPPRRELESIFRPPRFVRFVA